MSEISTEQIIKALRCTSSYEQLKDKDCTGCPYRVQGHLTPRQQKEIGAHTSEWNSCDVDKVGLDAADRLEELTRAPDRKKKSNKRPARASTGCCGYAPNSCLCSGCENAEACKEKNKGCCDIEKDATIKWTRGGNQCHVVACNSYKPKETTKSPENKQQRRTQQNGDQTTL